MAEGGNLIVANSSAYENFQVSFARNTEITNYTQREMGKEGDIHTRIKNGRTGTTERIYSNGKKSDKLGTMDLNSKRYAIFDALRKLDGNENDLSEKDLAKADALIGKNGVKAVRRDASAGITTIVCDDGNVLKFDLETDKEKQIREKQEAVKAKQKSDAAAEKKAQKRLDDIEYHEHCKSTFQKVCEWFVSLF